MFVGCAYAAVGIVVSVTSYVDGTETMAVSTADNLYECECDAEDIFPGDIVTFVMDDCGSPDIMDDIIVPDSFRYVGYIDETGVIRMASNGLAIRKF